MNRKRSSAPPKVMTWWSAAPALVVGGIFDVLRYFFLMFWLFGPVFAGIAASTAAGGGTVGHVIGVITTAAAGAAEFFIGPAIVAFGTVMSIAVAFTGFLAVTGILLMTDARVFKRNPLGILWLFEGLTVSTAVMVWGLLRTQIQEEKRRYRAWQEQQKRVQTQERAEENAFAFRQRAYQEAAAQEAAAVRKADAEEIPERRRGAA